MNPSTALATVLVDEWVRCGVREVVLCPGSRSAPLAYAAHAAECAGRLRLHVRIDERSAGFLAVGLAKVSRRPAVIITTSGTAVANLHPAVLEASHAAVPVIVACADRPAELRGTGANQTTVQPGIFAGALRFAHDQPPAQGRVGEQASWRTTACRAWAAAVGRAGDPGPVQVNVAFREPLAPEVGSPPDAQWPEPLDGRPNGVPWVAVSATPTKAAAEQLDDQLAAEPADQADDRHTRTLMILGDLPDPAMAATALRVAAAAGWPVVAEPFGSRPSRHTVLPHGPLVLADPNLLETHPPQRVLTVGRSTLHRDISAVTRRDGVALEHVSATEQWTDPSHRVSRVYSWRHFTSAEHAPADSQWADAWHQTGIELAARLEAAPNQLSGVAVARTVLASLSADDTLVAGSSNPARDLNLADPAAPMTATIVGNRGLAGIDGTISTAVGVALAVQGRVVALMGDLTFQHDVNGLAIGPDEPHPDLSIVVNNDDGGGIFATLEYGEPGREQGFRRLFATPTGSRLADLCAGYRAEHIEVTTVSELSTALRRPTSGIRVIEVRIDPHTDVTARQCLRDIAGCG